jgi:hypothetical protein
MCLGLWFANCACPYEICDEVCQKDKKKVFKGWSFFRNILRQVLGFVDVFGLRFVVWSDCVANLFAKCEVKVNLFMWVCGR